MKTIPIFISLVLLAAASVPAIPHPEFPLEPDSLEKIEIAQSKGLLDEETALVYKVKAYSRKGELPKEFQSETAITCGTPLMDELAGKWGALSEKVKTEIKDLLPETIVFETAGDINDVITTLTNQYKLDKSIPSKKKKNNFVLYYTTTGPNAISDIKYVKKAGKSLEKGYKWIKKIYNKTAKNASPMPVFFYEREYGACTYIDAAGNPPTAVSYITMERDLDQKASPSFKKYGKLLKLVMFFH